MTLIGMNRFNDRRNTAQKCQQELYTELTIDTLAKTIWGEARGEGNRGLQAVANVIINRVNIAQKREKYWWGNDIIQVCQKPYQFSCWNRSDKNYPHLIKLNETDKIFVQCLNIAYVAYNKKLPDITDGATHYHAKNIKPYWAKHERPTKIIGHHHFYNLHQ